MTQIGQILVQKGYISQQQLDAALSQQGDGQIGQLLIAWGWITKEQLDDALQIQAPPPPTPPPPPVYTPPIPPPVAPPSAPDLTMDTLQTSKFKIDMKTLIWIGSLLFTGASTYFGFMMELNSRFDSLEDVDNSAMVELERKFTALENKFTPIGEGVYSADPNSTWPPSRTEYSMKDQMSRNLLVQVQKEIEDLKKDIDKLESK
mgnify:CR=1 FL=1